MSLVPMLLLCLLGRPPELEAALATLRSPSASFEDIRQASAVISASPEAERPQLVEELIGYWAEGATCPLNGRRAALRLACSMADDRAAERITDTARRMVRHRDPAARDVAGQILGEPAILLSDRMSDPEPLLALLAECGCDGTIIHIKCSPDLREEYLIRAVQAAEPACAPTLDSLFCYLGDSKLSELRLVLRKLSESAPQSRGFDLALRTLVDAEDPEVPALLKTVIDDERFNLAQRALARVYLAKLQYQHADGDLMRLLRTERQYKDILEWAVWRLLWRKADKDAIRGALAAAPGPGAAGANIAGEVLRFFFAERESAPPTLPRWYAPLLVFDRAELRAMCSQIRDPAEQLKLLQQLSLPAMLARARPVPEARPAQPTP